MFLMSKIALTVISLIFSSVIAIANPIHSSQRLDAARNIVDSVNAKDPRQYVRDLAQQVIVTMYDGEVRLSGIEAVLQNRTQHFKTHPYARNELVHLVEIDNRVIMHDKVWLHAETTEPANIVEIFTFENGKIVRIDVIQPADLFSR